MAVPIIDQDKHTTCKTCKEICPMDVFDFVDGKTIVARPEDCIGCRACEVQCEDQAVIVKD